jgi:hypothetical protein
MQQWCLSSTRGGEDRGHVVATPPRTADWGWPTTATEPTAAMAVCSCSSAAARGQSGAQAHGRRWQHDGVGHGHGKGRMGHGADDSKAHGVRGGLLLLSHEQSSACVHGRRQHAGLQGLWPRRPKQRWLRRRQLLSLRGPR